MDVGLNMFSLWSLIQTDSDYINTLLKVKELGYNFVQFSGTKYSPKKIQAGVKESGLPVVLTHVPFELITESTDQLVDEHFSFGCKNIGLGSMPDQYKDDENVWKAKIDALNKAGEKIKNAGGKLFYHHHHFEFSRFKDGQTVFDYMKLNAPFVNFTLDSYWLQYGGQNVETFANDLAGRMDCVHLKDYCVLRDNLPTYEYHPVFCPVGSGNLNMPKLIEIWKNLGAKYFLVEQDNACNFEDPFSQVGKSAKFLKNI